MNTQGSRGTYSNTVRYETAPVGGLHIAYREAGSPQSPKLVLLHGFRASSHQYRNLVPALADRFHVVAPDYPGFGNSDIPDPATFAYTFERLFFFSSRRRHTRCLSDWSSDVCSSD